MKLDNRVILEKLRAYFSDPLMLPDLPDYIVATWRTVWDRDFKTAEELEEEKEVQGAIFNTSKIDDLKTLYVLLRRNAEVKDLRLYQITPERIVFLLEYMGVKL